MSGFSIRVGTIFEDSKIAIRKWLAAIWMITSHRKGIASTQLARDIDVTQKTAWFMLHSLRHAARTRSFNRPLRGHRWKADDVHLGGREKNKHRDKRKTKLKVVAMGMLERGGELRLQRVSRLAETRGLIKENVEIGARLMTDEAMYFKGLEGLDDRHTVNHSKGEYGRGDAHTNSIELVWALLKRQIIGIHHWISAEHSSSLLGRGDVALQSPRGA